MSTGWWIVILIGSCMISACVGFGLAAILSVSGDEDYIEFDEVNTYE